LKIINKKNIFSKNKKKNKIKKIKCQQLLENVEKYKVIVSRKMMELSLRYSLCLI